ncbi:hypothetical protein DES36_1014 [Alkalibaculum bacchi]|uniref:Uncharacterized protein n=1 Tax=Alkalibaculum bacchi TaxID=645887 RepID=A0A366IF08_9FIRM|nr:hypothetical protein DES36_1014 [Alkalibaculum bacchi]
MKDTMKYESRAVKINILLSYKIMSNDKINRKRNEI